MKTAADHWPGATWYQSAFRARPFAPVAGDCRAAVAVIGAGLAGVSTALGLVERGVNDVVVVDSRQPGAGASGRNGGFVFAGYSLDNERLVRDIGADRARLLHGWTRESRDLIRRRIDRYRIECQVNDAGVLQADWFGDDAALTAHAERMARDLGFRLDPVARDAMPDYVRSQRYGMGLHEPGSFHFHPLAYIRGLCSVLLDAGARVYGDSSVETIERSGQGWVLNVPGGRIRADEVVLATGGYDRSLWPRVQRALQPIATYIAVTRPLADQLADLIPHPVAVYDTRFAFDYYRPLPDTRLLWGGRISVARRSPRAIRRLMQRDLRRVFPELADVAFDYAWGGWMSYACHEMPLLGRTREGLWHALAFGGHGMATTTLAGEVMAEALTDRPERMTEFVDWPPTWAGGLAGRAGVQALYWALQARDGLNQRFAGSFRKN